MNFSLSKRNLYTFHHIVSRSIGGVDAINNGAILTKKAHDLLHLLEIVCFDASIDLQNIFIGINESNCPPTVEIKGEIDEIMYHIFIQDIYIFIKAKVKKYQK